MRNLTSLGLAIALAMIGVSARPQPAHGQDAAPAGLARPISIAAVDRPLIEVLDQIGKDANVTLRLADDYEDRAITMRVQELPAGQLINAIAALYGDLWEKRQRGNRTVYTLTASARRKDQQAKLTALFDDTLKTALMQTMREAAENPPKWMLGRSDPNDQEVVALVRARARALSMLQRELVDHLFAGGTVRIPLAHATGPAGEALWEFARREMPDPTFTEVQRSKAVFTFSAREYDTPLGLPGVPLVSLAVHISEAMDAGFWLPTDPVALRKAILERASELRVNEEQSPISRRSRLGKASPRTIDAEVTPKDAIGISRSAILVNLAEQSGITLIADSHSKPPLLSFSLAPGVSLEEALSTVCEATASFWRVEDGPVVAVRSQFWWTDDPAEPPASKTLLWEQALKQAGVLSLATTAEIAALSPPQLLRLSRRLPETRVASDPWLHLYSRLNADQQRKARRNGLAFWELPAHLRTVLAHPRFWSRDLNLLRPERIELIDHPAALLRVEERRDDDKPARVRFTLEPVPDATGMARGMPIRYETPLPTRRRALPAPAVENSPNTADWTP